MERLRVYFAMQDDTYLVVFSFAGKHAMTRMATLPYSDTEALSASFDRDTALHSFVAQPRMLTRILDYMHSSDEVSFLVTGGSDDASEEELEEGRAPPTVVRSVIFQSYVPRGVDEKTVRANLVTAMTMSPVEFEAIGLTAASPGGDVATDVTFSLKAFKALLAFAEDRNVGCDQVAMFWDGPGAPLLLTTNGGCAGVEWVEVPRVFVPACPLDFTSLSSWMPVPCVTRRLQVAASSAPSTPTWCWPPWTRPSHPRPVCRLRRAPPPGQSSSSSSSSSHTSSTRIKCW